MRVVTFLFLISICTAFLFQCTPALHVPLNETKKVETLRYYSNGLKAVKKNNKWGYVDKLENVVIPYKFSVAGNFNTNTTCVSNGDAFALIDIKGNMVTDWKYDTLFNTYKQFVGQISDGFGMIDSTGKEAIPFIYEDYNSSYKNNHVFKKNGQWGTVGADYEDFENAPAFLLPDVMPKFPGCPKVTSEKEWKGCSDKKLLTHIYRQIKYPPEARQSGIQGTVVISFIVNKTGEVEQAEIVREIGAGCGAECLRIVNSMPRWTPGQHDGETVVSRFNLPIKFRLE